MSDITENRESFLKRFEGKFSEVDIENIDFAYDIAKSAHRTAVRDGGVRYFEHPRSLCLILTDELGLYGRDFIISLLLHDVGEDTPVFGNILKSYDIFKAKAQNRISKIFGDNVADIVLKLTKPSIDNIRFHNQEEVFAFYFEELKKNEDAILLKMVDRLHNLRTLSSSSKEKIARKAEETEEKYLPIFNLVKGKNKQYADILLLKINTELEKLKAI